MKCAIYVRSATKGEFENKLRYQIDECSRYIHRRGGTVAAIFADEGVGGNDFAPDLERMKIDLHTRIDTPYQYDAVVVYGTDRIARDECTVADFIQYCHTCGVKLCCANPNIPDAIREFDLRVDLPLDEVNLEE